MINLKIYVIIFIRHVHVIWFTQAGKTATSKNTTNEREKKQDSSTVHT